MTPLHRMDAPRSGPTLEAWVHQAVPDFRELYGRAPGAVASAPGCVDLLGEHTDPGGGLVLTIALPLRTRVELAPHGGDTVLAWSAAFTPEEPVPFTIGREARTGTWLDHVQGVVVALAAAGHRLGGFDLRVVSDVPVGSGLASSAALEVALLRALRDAFALRLDDGEIARLASRAEADFVGAPIGVHDPMAVSLATEQAALLLDPRDLSRRTVPLPAGSELAVVDTGLPPAQASGEAVARRDECARAAKLLGVASLRDVGVADLHAVGQLPPPLDRRARHVVTENARVLAAVEAAEAGNARMFGHLVSASHASMRDDLEVSLPVIDRLVELAKATPGVLGARLTGGGFGGCVLLVCEAGHARGAAGQAAESWRAESGEEPRVRIPAGSAACGSS